MEYSTVMFTGILSSQKSAMLHILEIQTSVSLIELMNEIITLLLYY